MRVLHEHFQCDPATLEETHLRDYLLHIKLDKHWKPKTIRQTLPPPDAAPPGAAPWPRCPTCDSPMRLMGSILPPYRTLVRQRGPPAPKRRRNQAISSVLP